MKADELHAMGFRPVHDGGPDRQQLTVRVEDERVVVYVRAEATMVGILQAVAETAYEAGMARARQDVLEALGVS